MGKLLADHMRSALVVAFALVLCAFGVLLGTSVRIAFADAQNPLPYDVTSAVPTDGQPAVPDRVEYHMFNNELTKVELWGTEVAADLPIDTDQVIIYRTFNTVTGEHLYSSQYSEVISLIDGNWSPWRLEGVAWNAPSSGDPVYRLYNPYTAAHVYTMDTNEVETLQQIGWTVDNDGTPWFYSGGPVDIYRLYQPGNFDFHLLTTDELEYDLLPEAGWLQEGIALQCIAIGNAFPTDEEIYRRAMAVYSAYPEGSIWPDWWQSERYYTQGEWDDGYYRVSGGTCFGFALLMSDAVFGNRYGYTHSYDGVVRPGDIIHMPGHYSFVIKVDGTKLTCVDGNSDWNGAVQWGRVRDLNEITIDEVLSRY